MLAYYYFDFFLFCKCRLNYEVITFGYLKFTFVMKIPFTKAGLLFNQNKSYANSNNK